jgi:hypothetical protein
MNVITLKSTSIKEMIHSIDDAVGQNFTPSVAFMYASSTFNIKKLSKKLKKYTFHIVGATTVGEVYANKEDGINEVDGHIVCMLLELNSRAMEMTFIDVQENQDAYMVGKHIGMWAKSCFSSCAVITLTSGLSFDNDAYTQGILSREIEYIFGGSAGDGLLLKETFIFSNSLCSNQGVVALALDKSKIDIAGSRAFGWSGIGKERIVTKAIKNIVYEIDGFPAIDFYKRYLDITDQDMPQVGIEYPLEVRLRNGQVVYRAVLDIDELNGSLIFAGHVEEKARVRISAPQGKSIINEVKKSIDKTLKKRPSFSPEVGLVFPCCSRKQVLGHLTYLEIEAVYNSSKVPLIGFFAYGEIAAFPGGYCFHNETFVTLFLEEKGAK